MNEEQKKVLYSIKGRWPEAEETTNENPWAHWYVRGVIKGRWPEAEETINKDPEQAFFYALYVINGRWPEAEETINQNPEWAYKYAAFVIKGRWQEAEETLSQNPEWAFSYINDVIKGQRSTILELKHLDDAHLCKFSTVRLYVSKIDWSDPANDFPIPKRLNKALKKACVASLARH